MTRIPYRVLLGVSLLFNVFFIVGFFSTRVFAQKAETPEGRSQLLTRELGLSEEQSRALADLRKRSTPQLSELQQAQKALNQAIRAELGKRHPDNRKIRKLVAQNAEYQEKIGALATDYFVEFVQVLTPQQHNTWLKLAGLNQTEEKPCPGEGAR